MRLFVGNLSYQTTDADLQKLFSYAGEVKSARIVTDHDTRRSRGFGFVEMSSKIEGEAAISRFNGVEINGRGLTVVEAKPRQNRNGRSDRGRDNHRGGNGSGRRGGHD